MAWDRAKEITSNETGGENGLATMDAVGYEADVMLQAALLHEAAAPGGEAAAAAGVGGLELLPATTDGQSTLVQAAASDELLPGGA